jgi:succinyl-CoA synthetase alpha subunit
MGRASAVVSEGKGTAQGKMDAAAAGVKIGLSPTEACELMAENRQKPFRLSRAIPNGPSSF